LGPVAVSTWRHFPDVVRCRSGIIRWRPGIKGERPRIVGVRPGPIRRRSHVRAIPVEWAWVASPPAAVVGGSRFGFRAGFMLHAVHPMHNPFFNIHLNRPSVQEAAFLVA
jgi:hypothetical protein